MSRDPKHPNHPLHGVGNRFDDPDSPAQNLHAHRPVPSTQIAYAYFVAGHTHFTTEDGEEIVSSVYTVIRLPEAVTHDDHLIVLLDEVIRQVDASASPAGLTRRGDPVIREVNLLHRIKVRADDIDAKPLEVLP